MAVKARVLVESQILGGAVLLMFKVTSTVWGLLAANYKQLR